MNNQQLILGAGILLSLIITAAILIIAAWREGRRQGLIARKTRYGEELQQLRDDLQTAKAEQEQLQHTLDKSQLQTQRMRNDIERTRDTAAQALEQQQLHHDHKLQALRAQFTPLSLGDVTTIQLMAEKLNLAASALHATGSFKDSREAKNLASSGFRIASDLNRARALQEAA